MLVADKSSIAVNNSAIKPQISNLNVKTMQRYISHLGTTLFFFLVAVILFEGWQIRDENFISAENGLGYALGIIGGVMMLMLLVYPLRKRLPALRVLGQVKHWFRIHMILGVLGPSVILFHSSFQLGALNSNVALFCMLIVASSGLLGRYFYSKIHNGLYGEQSSLHELQQDSVWTMNQLTSGLNYLAHLKDQLVAYEKEAIAAGSSGLASIVAVPWFTMTSWIAYFRIWRLCKKSLYAQVGDPDIRKEQLHQTHTNLRRYFSKVRKVAEFSFYQRLFSLWHVLHLPLFVMMLITGIIHVIAVHMY